MKQAAPASINYEIARLDELLALLGETEPDAAELPPQYPLLEEHVRAARTRLLGAARWEYEDSLKQSLLEARKIDDHPLRKTATHLLDEVLASHLRRHRDD